MMVSFRPHYLPHEFQRLTVILVYVPVHDNALAAERIFEGYNNAVSRATGWNNRIKEKIAYFSRRQTMCQRPHKGAEAEDQACQDQIQGQNGEEVHQWRCEGCLEESEHQ